ncbi:hypothetical protein M3J09_004805 [Ascochyta lentis]
MTRAFRLCYLKYMSFRTVDRSGKLRQSSGVGHNAVSNRALFDEMWGH